MPACQNSWEIWCFKHFSQAFSCGDVFNCALWSWPSLLFGRRDLLRFLKKMDEDSFPDGGGAYGKVAPQFAVL